MSFTHIPIDVFLNILKYMTLNDIAKLALTNKEINDYCKSEEFWRQLYVQDFPDEQLTNSSYYISYQYYDRKIWVVTIRKFAELYPIVNIFNTKKRAVEKILDDFYLYPMDESLIPYIKIRDILKRIDDDGEFQFDDMRKIINGNSKELLTKYDTSRKYNDIAQMSSEKIQCLFSLYLSIRKIYKQEILDQLEKDGNLFINNNNISIKRCKIETE